MTGDGLPDFKAQMRAIETRRLLADLEAVTAGRAMTRDERRRADRYRARLTPQNILKETL